MTAFWPTRRSAGVAKTVSSGPGLAVPLVAGNCWVLRTNARARTKARAASRTAQNLAVCKIVAGVLYNPAVMRSDLEPLQCATLVCPYEAGIAGHIGGKDRGETTGLASSSLAGGEPQAR